MGVGFQAASGKNVTSRQTGCAFKGCADHKHKIIEHCPKTLLSHFRVHGLQTLFRKTILVVNSFGFSLQHPFGKCVVRHVHSQVPYFKRLRPCSIEPGPSCSLEWRPLPALVRVSPGWAIHDQHTAGPLLWTAMTHGVAMLSYPAYGNLLKPKSSKIQQDAPLDMCLMETC